MLYKNKIFFSSRTRLTYLHLLLSVLTTGGIFFFFYSMNKSKAQTPLKLCWDHARWKWYVCKSYMKSSFQMEFPSCQFWIYSKEFPPRNHLGEVKIYSWKIIGENACEMWSYDFRIDSVHIHRYFMTAFGISNNNASFHYAWSFLSRGHQTLIAPKEYISKWCFYCKVVTNNL